VQLSRQSDLQKLKFRKFQWVLLNTYISQVFEAVGPSLRVGKKNRYRQLVVYGEAIRDVHSHLEMASSSRSWSNYSFCGKRRFCGYLMERVQAIRIETKYIEIKYLNFLKIFMIRGF
jgi:hypothetical protein